MRNTAILNLYPDSMGGKLSDAIDLLSGDEFLGAFHSLYLLPSVFHTDLDRGFSVISYDLNNMLATNRDLDRLRGMNISLKLDFILNHISVLSPQFQDILQHGDASVYRDFFIDWNRFWADYGTMQPEGYVQPNQEHMKTMHFRKAGLPFLMVRFPDGRDIPYWNTFYQEVIYPPQEPQSLMSTLKLQYAQAVSLANQINQFLKKGVPPSKMELTGFENLNEQIVSALETQRKYLGQMDLNLNSDLVWRYYDETLTRLADYGASIVRLDAFAYAPKAPGRRNFLNEPETWEVLERVRGIADCHQLTLLPEIHASYAEKTHERLAEKGYLTYDFFLPGLLIDAIENHEGTHLVGWAQELKDQQIRTVNMLGCHDGIPLLDLKGLIPDERIQQLIDLVVSRGGLIKNLHGQENIYYQVNATYYSALGEDDRKMLLARVLQLFIPGTPQVWYLDLFAGRNDLEAVKRGNSASHKEINRTNLTLQQIHAALEQQIVQDQLSLLKAYNQCGAFDRDAEMRIDLQQKDQLVILWKKQQQEARLEANLSTMSFYATMDTAAGEFVFRQT